MICESCTHFLPDVAFRPFYGYLCKACFLRALTDHYRDIDDGYNLEEAEEPEQ